MDVLAPILLVLAGLLLLAGGGEALVRAATTLAELAGVTPAVIGLTVVAIGTSLPELVVSLLAATRGEPDLAVANVIGSNIFNIAATLGVTALIVPLPVHGSAVRFEWPVMFGTSVWCMLLVRDGVVSRGEGIALLAVMIAFITYTVYVARRTVKGSEARQHAEQVEARDLDTPPAPSGSDRRAVLVSLGVLGLGIVGLVVGGRLLVDGAVAIARLAGISERVIGLTIVAGGTGAPELATSLVAAIRRRTDVAVANMIGSNVFNVLGILGVTAVVSPMQIDQALVRTDVWWMIGTSLLLLPLMASGGRISRREGGLLLGAYLAYLYTLLA